MAEDGTITGIHISNYKSIPSLPNLRIGRLTVLSGANSSGKSSLFQPLLLLKQTVEATTDPGPLQIDGPNVFFAIARDQILTRSPDGTRAKRFSVGLTLGNRRRTVSTFGTRERGLRLTNMDIQIGDGETWALHSHLPPQIINHLLDISGIPFRREGSDSEYQIGSIPLRPRILRERCFFSLVLEATSGRSPITFPVLAPATEAAEALKNVIHVPAFRNISSRNLAAAYTKDTFIGTFDEYVGSLVMHWQTSGNPKTRRKLEGLNRDLARLNLASSVHAVADNDVEVSLNIVPIGAAKVEFSLSDVGFGVSQALTVLTALNAATGKHLVYIEEPESHLHPRAQFELAAVIVDAIKRDCRIVIETHSAFLLLGLQEQIAKGTIRPEDVALHWTTLEDGYTRVSSSIPTETGSLGEWPVDFGRTLMFAQDRFLTAYEERAVNILHNK